MGICRSALFVPGIDVYKINKAIGSEADVVLMDLEDAVGIEQKDAARDRVAEVLLARQTEKTLWVRINPPGTAFFYKDLLAVVPARPDGIMVAKVEDQESVAKIDWLIGLLEDHYNIPSGAIEMVPMIENATGIKNAYEIAACSQRIKRITLGGVDYTQDLGVEMTSEGNEIAYARNVLALASRHAGIEAPLDTVYLDIKDAQGLAVACRVARSLGFKGKLVIHPGQIKTVNEIFSPTPAEISWASKIIESYNEAVAAGSGVVQLEGKMVEKPLFIRAQRIMDEARRLNLCS